MYGTGTSLPVGTLPFYSRKSHASAFLKYLIERFENGAFFYITVPPERQRKYICSGITIPHGRFPERLGQLKKA